MTLAMLKRALPLWTTAPMVTALTLRAGDHELASSNQGDGDESTDDDDTRVELLRRSRAGEQIELTLTCTPFLQHPTEPNRNFIRFRPGGLAALGRSGKGSVFLRDHRQGDLNARGGTVTRSKMARDDSGVYRLQQSIYLHEPWAVQKALTGAIDRFSIGWHLTGPVTCSLCKTPVLDECWHWPGDQVERDGGDSLRIEWILHSAELIETSAVCVPAVVGTTVDDIRAALVGHISPRHTLGQRVTRRHSPMYKRITAVLGLAEDAGDEAVATAIEALRVDARDSKTRLAAVSAQLEQSTQALTAERAAHEALKASLAQQEQDAFIADGIKAGKLRPGSKFESAIRKLHAIDAEAAREQLDSAPVLTPVGAPRQSNKPAPADDGPDELTFQQLQNAGIDDPAAFYAKHGGQ